MKKNAQAKFMKPLVMEYLRKGFKLDSPLFSLMMNVQKLIAYAEAGTKKLYNLIHY